jgi:non-specific serine/threonine protein kinase
MAGLTEDMFDLNRLQRYVGASIYERGRLYYQQGRVSIDYVEEDYATCIVSGQGGIYDVRIELDRSNLLFFCDCPYAEDGRICKHIVAAVMTVREHLRTHKPVQWQSQLSRVIQAAQTTPSRYLPPPFVVFFSMQRQPGYESYAFWKMFAYYVNITHLNATARALLQAGQPVEEVLGGVSSLGSSAKLVNNVLDQSAIFAQEKQAVVLANMLAVQARYYYATSSSLSDYLSLVAESGAPLFLGNSRNPAEKLLGFLPMHGRVQIELSRLPEGIKLVASLSVGEKNFAFQNDTVQVISLSPVWLLADRYLVQVDGDKTVSLLAAFQESPELIIPTQDEMEFLENYYLTLATEAELTGDAVIWEEVSTEPTKRLYLSDAKGEFKAELRYAYGEYELPYDSSLPVESLRCFPESWRLARIHRKPEFEQDAYQILATSDFGLKKASSSEPQGTYVLRARVHPLDFLMKNVPRMTEVGFEIFGEEALKTARVNRVKPTISFNVTSGIDWFDVETVVNYGEIEVSVKELRKALRKKEHYIKLADGSIGEIPEEWLERYKHLFDLGDETKNGVRLSNFHLTLLDQLLGEADQVRTDQEFKQRLEKLKNFAGVTSNTLPQGLTGELRPYQKAGFDWLHFLHEFNFGGCLADDMGLGKTIQVLAFLLSLREKQHSKNPDLIVLPRSLLVNWQREIGRFTPGLRFLEYFGSLRDKDFEALENYDLILTTYGVMLRDVEKFRGFSFHYVILDESQAIKNPVAQTSKAARLLKCEHRLVMTGTPVENSTFELWSQFAFLNPGLLGNLEYFRSEFGTPIEKNNDEGKADFLRKMVYPFILRRTKDQVAPELPPRTERVIYSDMEPGQRKYYNRLRDYYRGLLLGMVESKGIDNSRMKVLEGLLRLRQVCNHPALVDKQFRGESAKFELLLETLETLRSENHKALIFSQFVEMLRILRMELDRRKIKYTYLDGSTQDRQGQVDIFQSDQRIPFFLISLKAGGVGLNLTAADYVIHIDPWWNPAVEMQASDRTHRIGQEKPVFVYKLIARDSVEEKILQLQDRKRNLVDQLITTEKNFLKSLTAEDVNVLFS